MEERPKLPYYDPDYCLKIAKRAAAICVGFLIFELLVLLVVDPRSGRCPGWAQLADDGKFASFWIFVAFAAPSAFWICYVVFYWDYYSQKTYDDIAYKQQTFPFLNFFKKPMHAPRELNIEQVFLLNFNRLFLEVCIAWCLFCAIPIFLMATSCTSVPRYFGF